MAQEVFIDDAPGTLTFNATNEGGHPVEPTSPINWQRTPSGVCHFEDTDPVTPNAKSVKVVYDATGPCTITASDGTETASFDLQVNADPESNASIGFTPGT